VQRLQEFIAEAGAALARGIAEVLERALAERRSHAESVAPSAEAIDQSLLALKAIEERIAEIRQSVWEGETEDTDRLSMVCSTNSALR